LSEDQGGLRLLKNAFEPSLDEASSKREDKIVLKKGGSRNREKLRTRVG